MEFYIYLSVNVNWTFYVQTFIILSLDCKINRRRRLYWNGEKGEYQKKQHTRTFNTKKERKNTSNSHPIPIIQ